MLSSFLASVEVIAFRATEAYSSLDLTKVKYNVRKRLAVEKEKIIASTRSNNFKACKDIRYTC
jgi:hypothetical protein